MKRYRQLYWFLLVLLGISLGCALPVHPQDTTPLERGIYWFNHRSRGSTGTVVAPEPINKAITFLEQSLQTTGDRKKAAKYLLFSYYVKGTHLELPPEKTQSVLAKGKHLGEKMVERYPDYPPVLYGYLVNLGRWAEAHGILSAAREGVAGTIRKYSERLADIDPNYRAAAGYRLLGIVYHETPYIPFFLSWPSNQKALTYLEKALDIAPSHPGNNYYYANVLAAVGREQKALKILNEVVSMEPREGFVLEDRRVMNLAEGLKKQLGE